MLDICLTTKYLSRLLGKQHLLHIGWNIAKYARRIVEADVVFAAAFLEQKPTRQKVYNQIG